MLKRRKINEPKALWFSAQRAVKAATSLPSGLEKDLQTIPMGTNCAPLVADLFLFCFERDFMNSLSDSNQADIIEAFNSTFLIFR